MKPFSVQKRIKSFKYAFAGIWTVLKTQHNAWIHAVATIFVLILGFFMKIDRNEWFFVILCVALVWMSESLNTALEFLADETSPTYKERIKYAKDVAAGAVLISAIGSSLIGLWIFVPKILAMF